LGGVAFARIADYEEAEVAISRSALRIDPKKLIAAAVGTRHGIDHVGAPWIDPQLCQLPIDASRPAFSVEVPAETHIGLNATKKAVIGRPSRSSRISANVKERRAPAGAS
jgi:hypothetical protein